MTTRGGRATLGAGVALLLAIAAAGLLAAAGRQAADGGAAPVGSGEARLGPVGTGGTDASIAGRVAVSPIVVDLEVVPRKPKSKGPPEVRATVMNLSAARVSLVAIGIDASPATLVLKPTDAKPIRNLAAGRSADATWTLCSTSGGTFQLIARAAVDGASAASAPITVRLGASARC